MAGTGISDTMMFTAATILAIAFVGVFAAIIGEAGNDVDGKGEQVTAGLRTDVTLLNDPAATAVSPLVLHARNTGSAPIDVSGMLVFVDGEVQGATFYVSGSSDDTTWPPGAVLTATVGPLGPGEHRIRLVTEPGIEDVLLLQV